MRRRSAELTQAARDVLRAACAVVLISGALAAQRPGPRAIWVDSSAFRPALDTLAQAGVIVLVRPHGAQRPAALAQELALLDSLRARGRTVILSHRDLTGDEQARVDSVVAGSLPESAILTGERSSHPDLLPILNFARTRNLRVLAARLPFPLYTRISQTGFKLIRVLPPAERVLVASEWRCGVEIEPASSASTRVSAMACLDNETQAEAIVRARAAASGDAVVVHFGDMYLNLAPRGVLPYVAWRQPLLATRIAFVASQPERRYEPNPRLQSIDYIFMRQGDTP